MKRIFYIISLIFFILTPYSYAYKLNGLKKELPIKYYVNPMISAESKSDISQALEIWYSSTNNFIKFQETPLAEASVVFGGFFDNDSPLIGICTINSPSFITFNFEKFIALSKARRVYTVMHEVGHALGLDHTDIANQLMNAALKDDLSVLSTPGFDDLQGIHDLYYLGK